MLLDPEPQVRAAKVTWLPRFLLAQTLLQRQRVEEKAVKLAKEQEEQRVLKEAEVGFCWAKRHDEVGRPFWSHTPTGRTQHEHPSSASSDGKRR